MSSEESKTYKLRLSARAAKYLTKLDTPTAKRILNKLETLKTDPYKSPGVKLLTGSLAGFYRLRVGGYRAVYEIDKDDQIVIVLVIAPRGDVYKDIDG